MCFAVVDGVVVDDVVAVVDAVSSEGGPHTETALGGGKEGGREVGKGGAEAAVVDVVATSIETGAVFASVSLADADNGEAGADVEAIDVVDDVDAESERS